MELRDCVQLNQIMSGVRWQEVLPKIKHTFRDKFTYPHKKVTQWFPGHMNRGKQTTYRPEILTIQ